MHACSHPMLATLPLFVVAFFSYASAMPCHCLVWAIIIQTLASGPNMSLVPP